jgi:hypothetical protein
MGSDEHVVRPEEAGERLDVFLARTAGSRAAARVPGPPAGGGAGAVVAASGSGPTRAAMARNDAASASSTGGAPTRPTSRPPAAGPTSAPTWSSASWSPKPQPRPISVDAWATMALAAGLRIALPTRSRTISRPATCQLPASASAGTAAIWIT